MKFKNTLPKNIKLNESQKQISKRLENLLQEIASKPKSFLSKLITNKANIIYMHGSVGTGKTMLMNSFHKAYAGPKTIMHFHEFIQQIHKQLHQLSQDNISQSQRLQITAKSIIGNSEILCLDELDVRDITDAMIIKNIIPIISKMKVHIIITSNYSPHNLYLDGQSRKSFLPFISFLESKAEIIPIKSNIDYRMAKISNINNRIIELDKNNGEIQEVITKLSENTPLIPASLAIYGRNITFQQTHQNLLITDFNELLERDLSVADYIEICQNFATIIVAEVNISENTGKDILTRLTHFIDYAYINKVKLFIEFNSLEYLSESSLPSAARTISRLNEMNSKGY